VYSQRIKELLKFRANSRWAFFFVEKLLKNHFCKQLLCMGFYVRAGFSRFSFEKMPISQVFPGPLALAKLSKGVKTKMAEAAKDSFWRYGSKIESEDV
jgi:hypothetical protein